MGSPVQRVLVLVIALLHASCLTASSPGESALRRGDNATASRLFEEALEAKPDDLATLVGLGAAAYRLRAFSNAEDALERAIELDTRDPAARLFLALTLMRQGNLFRAEEELREYRRVAREPQGVALVDQALRSLASNPTAEQRASIADSLESVAESERTRH